MRDNRYGLVAVTFAALVLVLASLAPSFGYARTVLGECFLAAG